MPSRSYDKIADAIVESKSFYTNQIARFSKLSNDLEDSIANDRVAEIDALLIDLQTLSQTELPKSSINLSKNIVEQIKQNRKTFNLRLTHIIEQFNTIIRFQDQCSVLKESILNKAHDYSNRKPHGLTAFKEGMDKFKNALCRKTVKPGTGVLLIDPTTPEEMDELRQA